MPKQNNKNNNKKKKSPLHMKQNAAKKWAKKSLPLLHALKSFKSGKERSVLLNYLNDEACESIYHMIANVLRNKKVDENKRKEIFSLLDAHRADLRKVMAGKAKTMDEQRKLSRFKQRTLVKMGGGLLTTLLTIGIPILTSLIFNKKK